MREALVEYSTVVSSNKADEIVGLELIYQLEFVIICAIVYNEIKGTFSSPQIE